MSLLLDALRNAERENTGQKSSSRQQLKIAHSTEESFSTALKPSQSPANSTSSGNVRSEPLSPLNTNGATNVAAPRDETDQPERQFAHSVLTLNERGAQTSFPKLHYLSVASCVLMAFMFAVIIYLRLTPTLTTTANATETTPVVPIITDDNTTTSDPPVAILGSMLNETTTTTQQSDKMEDEHNDQPEQQVVETLNPAVVAALRPKFTQPSGIEHSFPLHQSNQAIEQTVSNNGASQHINEAYQSLLSGNVNLATKQYQALFNKLPDNKDVLYGVAAISAIRGDARTAARHYLQISSLYPQEIKARIALSQLLAQAAPEQSEALIIELAEKHPDSPELSTLLGNVCAGREDWSGAQQHYFRAVSLTPSAPESAFNLAVSLDHLGKHKAALRYYRKSIELTQTSTTSQIDLAVVQRRIATLQRLSAP